MGDFFYLCYMKTKYDKLAPIIEKIIKIQFKDKVEIIEVVVNKTGVRPITIFYKNSNELGIIGSIRIECEIMMMLKSVLNLNSLECELFEKYS